MTRRPTPTDRDNAAAWAAYSTRTSDQAERAVRVLLAAVVGVLLALALLHWATPCATATLCWAPLALPGRHLQRLRHRLQRQVRHQCRRLHMAMLRTRLKQLLGLAVQMALDEDPAPQLGAVLVKAAAVRLTLTGLEQQHRAEAWLARPVDWRAGDAARTPPAPRG